MVILPYIENANLDSHFLYSIVGGYHDWAYTDVPSGRLFNPFAEVELVFYKCPSDDRTVSASPYGYEIRYLRSYFAVAGGKVRETKSGSYNFGDVFYDGLFGLDKWRRFADIHDGSSSTLAVGERTHYSFLGMGPGYNVAGQGGPSVWWQGSSCYQLGNTHNCDSNNQHYGRTLGTTKYPINSPLPSLADYSHDNEIPFGSFHSGGAHFAFADGHVAFINETIDMNVYRALSTIDGGETISGTEY